MIKPEITYGETQRNRPHGTEIHGAFCDSEKEQEKIKKSVPETNWRNGDKMRKESIEEYRKFVENFKNEVCRLTEGWNAEITLQTAQEDHLEDYLTVETEGKNGKHVQRFHLWEMYQDLESEECTMEEIFSLAAEMLDCCKEVERISPLDKIQDYRKIRSHLIVRPLNYDHNMERLREGVYDRIGDIALALYADIGSIKEHYISSMIPFRAFSEWNQSKEEVMAAALRNTYELFPPRVIRLESVEDFLQGIDFAFMDSEELPFDPEGGLGIFLTNTSQMNGAVSIFLPGVSKKLGELLGGDFYIGFTSIHEAVLHKVGAVELERIQGSLRSMHSEVIEEKDFLSEQVYRYSRENDKIEVVKL